jgi:hypothetical protein
VTGPTAASATNAPVSSEGPIKRPQRYECAGVSFALPPDWEDVTTFVARAPAAESGSPVVLKVARAKMAPSDSLWTHAGHVIVNLAKEIPGFELRESRDVEVAGRAGVVFRFRLAMDAGTFEQYLVLLDPLDDPERRVSVFNLSGPETESARMRETLERILRSLEIPGRTSDSLSRGPRPAPSPTIAPSPPDLDYQPPMPAFRGR